MTLIRSTAWEKAYIVTKFLAGDRLFIVRGNIARIIPVLARPIGLVLGLGARLGR
jgi:hypothetical protein